MSTNRPKKLLPWCVYHGHVIGAITEPDPQWRPISSILVTDESIWVTTSISIVQFRQHQWHQIARPANADDTIVGHLLSHGPSIICSSNGVWRYDGAIWNQETGLPEDHVRDMIIDHDHTVWVAYSSQGLWLKENTNRQWVNRALPSGNTLIRALHVTKTGRVWVAEQHRQPRRMVIHGMDQQQWIATLPEGTPTRHFTEATTMTTDNAGNLYVGTFGHSLWKWNTSDWQHVGSSVMGNLSKVPANTISKMHVDQHGKVWAITHNGIAVYDGNTWRVVYVDLGQYNHPQQRYYWRPRVPGITGSYLDALGRLWIGTSDGILGWIDTNTLPHPDNKHEWLEYIEPFPKVTIV